MAGEREPRPLYCVRVHLERIYPKRAPMAEGERDYARSGHQWQKGRENMPVAGTNGRRGERTYTRSAYQWQKGGENIYP
eukprot:927762-Pyramimonas_sp.AAC.1